MSIPTGWTEVTNGEWGLGTEPFPENVPVGPRYVDEHGNRCVMTPDNNGTPKVEGIGTGVNAGKPDGEWWDWTELLSAGPTSAEPWIGSEPGLTPGEGTDETPKASPVAPLAQPQAPAPVDPNMDPTPDSKPPMQAPPLSAPSANPHVVGKPKFTLWQTISGWVVREEHTTGQIIEHALTEVEHAGSHLLHFIEAHK
jgi:hypothetical protein